MFPHFITSHPTVNPQAKQRKNAVTHRDIGDIHIFHSPYYYYYFHKYSYLSIS